MNDIAPSSDLNRAKKNGKFHKKCPRNCAKFQRDPPKTSSAISGKLMAVFILLLPPPLCPRWLIFKKASSIIALTKRATSIIAESLRLNVIGIFVIEQPKTSAAISA